LILDNTAHGMKAFTASVNLTAGFHNITINYFDQGGSSGLKLFYQGPGTPKQIVPASVLIHAQSQYDDITNKIDRDGDGLTDLLEASLGSDPLLSDTNGDGLTDYEKYVLGLDALSTDTDGDGISDYIEVKESFTNPKVVDFDGTVTDVVTLAGKDISDSQGTWEVEDNAIVAKRTRGFVEYTFNVAEQDSYRLNIEATHLWLKYSCSPVSPIDRSDLMISIDGNYLGKKNLVAPDGIYGTVGIITPFLAVGNHTVRIFWENVHSRISLKINELKVQSLGGPDSNNDGVKDWVTTSIMTTEGLNPVSPTSFVSPICLEGKTRHTDMISINGLPLTVAKNQGTGSKWFANVNLNDSAITNIEAKFQSGGLTQTATTTWTPLNLITNEINEITVRQGDTIKFTGNDASALPEDQALITIDGVTTTVAVGSAVTKKFDTAGIFTVSGAVNALRGSLIVKVMALPTVTNAPAFMIGKARSWNLDGLTANAVVEVDDTVELNRNGEVLNIIMNKTNRPHYLTVRSYENGPILQTVKLDGFWVQAAVDNYVWVVERHDDYQIWENTLIAKNLPDGVSIRIKSWKAGVLLEDGTLERYITNADLNELGEYTFRLIRPNTTSGSACHNVEAYQNGKYLGQAYLSGALMPEDD
ncbi:MAG: hypothetical protein KAG98_07725, partial [Lentisphaeria bacterium]|nr:hypothetical protein [Lentisphaeria bacterium]